MNRSIRRRSLASVLIASALLLGGLAATSSPANASTITVSIFAGNGTDGNPATDGVLATNTSLWGVSDLAVTAAGLFIADSAHNEVRLVDSTGTISNYLGSVGGGCDPSTVYRPTGLASGPNGIVFVSTQCGLVLQISSSGIAQIIAGNTSGGFYTSAITPGMLATDAYLSQPAGLDYDPASGALYIADQGSSRILMVLGGQISVVAGTGTNGFSGDGPALSNQLNYPRDVAVHNGLVYVADYSNGLVRTIDSQGNLASIATVSTPSGIAFDSTGTTYVAGGASGNIYTLDSAGALSVLTNLTGNAGGIAFDSKDNLFATDSYTEYVYEIGGLAPAPTPTPTPTNTVTPTPDPTPTVTITPTPTPTVTTPPAKPVYVALGDSYSSGEGAKSYLAGSDSPSLFDTCHRSTMAYAEIISAQKNWAPFTFAACSGAVTDDLFVTNPVNPNEPAQLKMLAANTDIVTLTIGGNDSDFVHIITKCLDGFRPPGTAPQDRGAWGCSGKRSLKNDVSARLSLLSGMSNNGLIIGRPIHALADVYAAIHGAAPNAQIFVGGYPHLFGSSTKYYSTTWAAPSGKTCVLARLTSGRYSIDYRDALWLNGLADRLNLVIKQQVDKIALSGVPIHYVAPKFENHALCDSSPAWINSLLISNSGASAESFHPTSIGQDLGYASAFMPLLP